eukprot:CAMPEP_0185848752 /NCGR_PEP_ID=MMETSP1354-20130828/3511_1 /TAXON_ID=708628 /ORGANISM="Erythrolobus madagascarensis, Strain CCMP3276" /LENGTH=151 /DNA_ID=CAMNT_0028549189 /DNA_START=55 /DNA_END=507 /DNA_ORIENTATION=+
MAAHWNHDVGCDTSVNKLMSLVRVDDDDVEAADENSSRTLRCGRNTRALPDACRRARSTEVTTFMMKTSTSMTTNERSANCDIPCSHAQVFPRKRALVRAESGSIQAIAEDHAVRDSLTTSSWKEFGSPTPSTSVFIPRSFVNSELRCRQR